jgi:putative transcriptional regulator
MNQTDLFRETGIRLAAINDLCNDKFKHIPVELIDKLCEYFKCDVGDLWEYIPKKMDE